MSFDATQSVQKYPWKKVKNVENPQHYTDDFDTDLGYFTEENGAHNRKIENGMLSLDARGREDLTYVHVFEKNVTFKARVRVNEIYADDAVLSFILRYNSEDAWVKLNYAAKPGIFSISDREGRDFPMCSYMQEYPEVPAIRVDPAVPAGIGEWHDITFTVDADAAEFYFDGALTLNIDSLNHKSPGRVGISARELSIDIDSVDIALLSDQGTVWKHVMHTKLPDEQYREGGSVFEMKDGKLVYTHHSNVSFESTDNGYTWSRREMWTDTHGYANILRLKNGDFMKMIYRKEDDGRTYVMSQTSSDDGETWVDGGKLLETPYKGTSANAGNMNDKITQISTGRIFYCMNYECSNKSQPVNGKYIVFCEFYYSDDNGRTWTKSETDSWDLPGNENQAMFGECKILECDDGTLRMYNSWNDHGCVVYSESFDNGVTWGELKRIPELVCARSSMQFYRDQYADNETTYYMVWVYSEPISMRSPMTRSRLSVAKSTNGKDWLFLGDLWRWEHNYFNKGSLIPHVVDSFIMTTGDYLICGAGFSEYLSEHHDHYHHAQRQHIYSIKKDSLTPVPLKPVN